jgi:hypothetical protein
LESNAKSEATISLTKSFNEYFGTQPSFSLAFVASPIKRSTSVGLKYLGYTFVISLPIGGLYLPEKGATNLISFLLLPLKLMQLISQIKLSTCPYYHIKVAQTIQFTNDGRANHTSVHRNVNLRLFFHYSK